LKTWLPSATTPIEVNIPGEEAESVTASVALSTSTDFSSGASVMSDSNISVNSETSEAFTTPPSSPAETGPLEKLKTRRSLEIGLRKSFENRRHIVVISI